MKDITITIKVDEIKSLLWAIHIGMQKTGSNRRYDRLDEIDQRINNELESQ